MVACCSEERSSVARHFSSRSSPWPRRARARSPGPEPEGSSANDAQAMTPRARKARKVGNREPFHREDTPFDGCRRRRRLQQTDDRRDPRTTERPGRPLGELPESRRVGVVGRRRRRRRFPKLVVVAARHAVELRRRGQSYDRLRALLRRRQRPRDQPARQLRRSLPDVRRDRPRVDRVGRDARMAPRELSGEKHQSELRVRVRLEAAEAARQLGVVPVDAARAVRRRAHVHHARPGRFLERGHQELRQQKGPEKIRRPGDLVPVGIDPAVLDGDSGVVDENVERRVRREEFLGRAADRDERGHVDHQQLGASSGAGELRDDGLSPRTVARAEDDARAHRREGPRRFEADPSRRARDEDRPAGHGSSRSESFTPGLGSVAVSDPNAASGCVSGPRDGANPRRPDPRHADRPFPARPHAGDQSRVRAAGRVRTRHAAALVDGPGLSRRPHSRSSA